MSDRSYIVGLPVVLTVHEDGSVSAAVDLSEAYDIDAEHAAVGQPTDPDVIDSDSEVVSDAVETGRIRVTRG